MVRAKVLKCYDIDKVIYKKVHWRDLIQAYKSLEKVNDMIWIYDLDYFNTLVVIKDSNLRLEFVFKYYAGVLEDDEEITIYSERCETFGSAYGKIRINKHDFSIKIEPMDFVPDVSGYYHIFGKECELYE